MERSTPPPSVGKFKQSCFNLPIPCAPFTPMVSGTCQAIETRSLVITPAHAIMFQVLTGMRSSRAHRPVVCFTISSTES